MTCKIVKQAALALSTDYCNEQTLIATRCLVSQILKTSFTLVHRVMLILMFTVTETDFNAVLYS